MPHVRSVSIGVWLTARVAPRAERARRHRPLRRAHALQGHDTPLGRGHRPAGGFDRRAARRVHVEGVRRLLRQGARRAPAARDRHPVRPRRRTRSSSPTTSSARRRSSSKRSRWSRTRPTISCTSSSPSVSGTVIRSGVRSSARPTSVSALDAAALRRYFRDTYVAEQFVVVAVGNLEHAAVRRSSSARSRARAASRARRSTDLPPVAPRRADAAEGARTEPRVPWHDRAAAESSRSLCRVRAEHRARRVDELAPLSERAREAWSRLLGVFVAERLSGRRRSASTRAAATKPSASSIDVVIAEIRRLKDDAAAGRRAAARQGSPEGLADAQPGEHVEPHVASRASGDLSRPRRHARRDARGDRARHDRGRAAARDAVFPRRRARRDRARQRQRPRSVEAGSNAPRG